MTYNQKSMEPRNFAVQWTQAEMVGRLASFDRDALAAAKAMVNCATLPPDADLITAFREFMGTFASPDFANRAEALGGMVARHGMEVEMRLGEFLADVNSPR